MPIELTREQQEQLDKETARPHAVRDPRSDTHYVLVPAEQYEQMLEVIEDDAEQRALRRAGARGLGNRLANDEG
jgi:hypothetical protein